MAPTFSKQEDMEDELKGWTLVYMNTTSGDRSPQYKDCNISSSQNGAHTAGSESSDLTTKVDHRRPGEAKGIYVHPVKVQHSEYGESTTTGPKFNTPESNGVHSFSLIHHLEPCPLAPTMLNVHSVPGLSKDIKAWASGELDYWRPVEDNASIVPSKEGTRRLSSDGGFGSVHSPMPPINPSTVGQDTQYAGGNLDDAVYRSPQLEID